MGRQIVTKSDVLHKPSGSAPLRADDYSDRLLKYIPAEAAAAYIALDGIVKTATDLRPQATQALLWAAFGLVVIGTVFYLRRLDVKRLSQMLISIGAVIVWVFAMGGAFAFLPWYRPLYGALLLPAYTFIVGAFEPK